MGPRILGAALVGLPATALVLMGWLAPEGSTLDSAIHGLGAVVCHADPGRSFEGAAVCHRCTGIYAGVAVGGWLSMAFPRVPFQRVAWWVIAIGPLALQVALGLVTAALDLWWLRLGTGLVFGAMSGLAIAHALRALTRPAAADAAPHRPT
ncbi:MAG: DUF2085 domain-containing protein [Deltaproteobacteria bacterium]|nr:DUF2085 domain-containing protein [Deltaproteobacteria bacterium]